MAVLLTVLAALFGAAAGALLPRAAHRLGVAAGLPRRSRCPDGHPFARGPRGWLGPARCSLCRHAPAPMADPATAATAPYGALPAAAPLAGARTGAGVRGVLVVVCALLCAVVAGVTGARPEAAVWVLAVPCGALLTVVDLRVRRLPDLLTLPLAAGLAALLGGCALLPGAAGSWRTACWGGLALGGFYGLLHLVNPGGMGLGDVKLAIALGVALGWYGWGVLLAGGFAGLLLGAVSGAVMLLTSRTSGDASPTTMAFGPFLLAGAFLGVVLGAAAGG